MSVARERVFTLIDIQLDLRRVDYDNPADTRKGESSAAIRDRIEAARQRQQDRYRDNAHILTNSDLGPSEINQFCVMADVAAQLLRASLQRFNLSARAYHRVLKISRTIADLAASEVIRIAHVAEAVQYRSRT
ncbi:MAG: ATP-binding protein [Anaerolineae bacterium]|nr:ATP-binding protein [Anaerolineae bacterium]